jgi:putative hemolysin
MKQRKLLSIASFALLLVFLGAGCNPFAKDAEPEPTEPVAEESNTEQIDYGDAQMAEDTALSNPATVYCLSQDGQFYMKKTLSGVTEGYCVLPNGLECEVWAMYKGECGKAKKPEPETQTTSTKNIPEQTESSATSSTLIQPSTTSTAQESKTSQSNSEILNDGKKKIEGEIDIAIRPGTESGEMLMSWDTHDFPAPEGYIVMLGTNSKLSHPTKYSHILQNENSYSFTWTGLNPERDYYFRVCIKKGDSCSTYSPVISNATQ